MGVGFRSIVLRNNTVYTMMARQLLLLIVLFLGFNGLSQEMSVKGTVYDTTGTKPVKNALAMAVRVSDSMLLDFKRTDANGQFEITGFEIDTFSLIISHPDADDKTYFIFGADDNFDITIPSIILPPKSQEFEEVVIYAYKDPIYYKGDTLVYIADSFQVDENAVVEDLLKKLPGVTIDKDGNITTQGEEIAKVLVDGDEFFGDDPTIATKNLGAKGVETVEIYEKENDEGIGGDDEKIKVLDLRLKEDAKKGYFGRISGASDFALTPIDGEIGTNPFYEGELLFNKFSGSQKISVFALGSNTPRSNFGFGDAAKFGLENESVAGNRWNPGAQDNTNGIPETFKSGIYYSDKFGEKKQHKITANYSFYRDQLDARAAQNSFYILPDTSYITDDSTRDFTLNTSHRFNIDYEWQIDSLTRIQIKPNFSLDARTQNQTSLSDFFTTTGVQTLGTEVFNDSESDGISGGGFARIIRKFNKPKRELEVRYDMSLTDNSTTSNLRSYNTYFDGSSVNDTLDQRKFNDNASIDHYGQVTYIEPLGSKFALETEYLFETGRGNQDVVVLDRNAAGEYIDTNNNLTNLFDNSTIQNRIGVKLIFDPKKHRVAAGVRVRNIDWQNVNRETGARIDQDLTNILPSFEYRYRPSMSKQIRFNYRTSSQRPSLRNLQPIPDNSNPNRVLEGNPELRPNYMHSMNVMFNSWKALSGQYVWSGANVILTQDAFGDSTTYDNFGRQTTRTVNVDGNIIANIYGGAGFSILGRKIEFRPGLTGSFFRGVSYIEALENKTDNLSIAPSLGITFRFLDDSLEIYSENSYSYSNTTTSFNSTTTPFTTLTNELGFKWRIKGGWTLSSDATYTENAVPGDADGFFNTSFFVWNAEFSKNFLKTQNLNVALQGNDILNQNINARREVTGTIITDYRTQIISRYFLLKVTLRFNNRRAPEEDFKMF
ncbi:MAG: outer membrane beta-barrel protein [Fluviicola sp.]